MNRALLLFCLLILFICSVFLNQAFDQREQEKRNTDDTGRKPDCGTEGSELLQSMIIFLWLYQCGGIPLHCQANTEDDNQQQAEKQGNGTGFFVLHNDNPQLRNFL